jgi:acetyl esterase/lipase
VSVLDLPPPPADHRVHYGPEAEQFGDLRLPRQAAHAPLVVVIHGGFWRARYDLGHIGHLCAALTRAGFATWSLEYRRVGMPGGGFPGTLLDVARAADFVPELARRFSLDASRTVVVGHSAGGHLALWLCGRQRVDPRSPVATGAPFRFHGAVPLAPVSDLLEAQRLRLGDGIVEEFLGGSPAAVREHYAAASPAALLPHGVPTTIVHGTEDGDVPFALSEGFVKGACTCGDAPELRALPGLGHFEPIDPGSAAWPAVLESVSRLAR